MNARSAQSLAAACLCASLLVFSLAGSARGSAPLIERARLPAGSTLIVRRDPSVPTVAIELWFRAPSTGFDQPVPGLARYAALAIGASKSGTDPSLSQQVRDLGGRFAVTAYADSVSIAISVPAGTEARMLKALSHAYFTPVLSAEGMRSALRDVVIAASQKKFDPDAFLHDAVFTALFSAGPAHYSTLPATTPEISAVGEAELERFARRAFRSSNAVIALAGNVQADIGASVDGRVDGQPMEAPIDSTPAADPVATAATFAEDASGLGWIGPPISDAKAATAMDFIADYLFRPDTGTVARATDLDSSDVFLTGQFITLHNPGVLLVEIAGKNYSVVRDRVQSAVTAMHAPLSQQQFSAAVTAFEYHIRADSQTPLNQADNFGWYSVEGDPAYAPSDDGAKYLSLIHSLDAAYVAHIASQYLAHPLVITAKGTDKP